ncbi:hypothetical protein [Rufibacter soli]
MGRVPRGKAFKGHNGQPFSSLINQVVTQLPDLESVEAAVKGTVASTPASILDFASLVQQANWQMLDEAEPGVIRGMEPTQYQHFAGYPRPTVTVTATEVITTAADGSRTCTVTATFTLNNKVGFDFTLSYIVRLAFIQFTEDEKGGTTSGTISINKSFSLPAGQLSGVQQTQYVIPSNRNLKTGQHNLLLSSFDSTHYYGPGSVTVTS